MPILPLVFAVASLAQVPTAGHVSRGLDLVSAARVSDAGRVRELVAAGVPVDTVDRRGYTPLMWAAATGNAELAKYLLDSGAIVQTRAADGTTALFLAAANGAVDAVRLLLSRGANPLATREGLTPRRAAVSRSQADIVSMLEAAEGLGAQLIQAVSDGQAVSARQLVARGAPVNIVDGSGVTPLMFAARNGDLGTMVLLLSRGADGLARDAEGQSVVTWAEKSPSTRPYVVAFLRDRVPAAPALRGAPVAVPPIADTLRTLDALLTKSAPAAGPALDAHRRARAALTDLRTLSRNWPAESPADYRANLAIEATSLGAAIDGKDPQALQAVLEAVADDLEAKLEHCRQSGGRLGGSVLVRVRTVQAGAEASRWQVFYMPKIFEVSPSPSPDLFPQLSSPTEDLLVPGRYLMWVRNPATAAVGERTVVKVGEGRKELIVDLPVPAAGK